jgi:hypothetical protein
MSCKHNSAYTLPKLTSHKVPYKGRRYWVFEVNKEHPYDTYEDCCDTIVYDKFFGIEVAFANKQKDGSYKADIPYGQQSIDITAVDPKDLVDTVIYWERWMKRESR